MSAANVTLVAKTRVKFGGEGHMDRALGFVRTAEATEVEPGETFETDADTAEDLIRVGAAMTTADAEAAKRTEMDDDEKIEEMRATVGAFDLKKKAREGDSQAINSNAHLEKQKREDLAIKDAQDKAKGKGKKGDKTDDAEGDGKPDKPKK